MNDTERTAWDRRYREGSHQSLTPDPLLVSAYEEFIAPVFTQPGRCLDLAGGVGRHAIFLAERSWDVTLIEISPAGLDIAKHEIGKRGLHVSVEQADLTQVPLPVAGFDLVLNFFYLERTLFSQIAKALKPGGLLIFKTYTREQLRLGGGPSHPMHLLESNELLRAFAALRILHYHESMKDKAVAELVAQKE
jgi:tellurite methyltransferase